MEIPNSNTQITNKFQIPKCKIQTGWKFVIGHWVLFGIWILSCGFFFHPEIALAKTPNDPSFANQWYLQTIQAPAAWDITTGNRQTIVAVLDTGIDLEHEDLQKQIWTNSDEIPDDGLDNDANGFIDDVHGWDFVDDDVDPNPSLEDGYEEKAVDHGTIVAGIIGAVADNNEGITGINWRVRLMPVRMLDAKGLGSTETAAAAVNYAVENGADIINMSFSGLVADERLERAVRNAYRRGVLIVAAVGNNPNGGTNLNESPNYPVCFDSPIENWVFGVAATDADDTRAYFSNYGSDCTDISAPGTDVFGTLYVRPDHPVFNRPYDGWFNGTSVAAPQVTAAASLIKGAYPTLSLLQVKVALQLSVDPIKTDPEIGVGAMGAGRLNVARALETARQLSQINAEH